MIRIACRKSVSVLANRLSIKIGEAEVWEDPAIWRFLRLVGQHSPDFIRLALVVPFIIAAKSSFKWILSDKYGTLSPVGPRHLQDQNVFVFKDLNSQSALSPAEIASRISFAVIRRTPDRTGWLPR
jgi:hypothetical protein